MSQKLCNYFCSISVWIAANYNNRQKNSLCCSCSERTIIVVLNGHFLDKRRLSDTSILCWRQFWVTLILFILFYSRNVFWLQTFSTKWLLLLSPVWGCRWKSDLIYCDTHIVQVYYHLGSFEDSVTYALGADKLFNVNASTEYVETIVGRDNTLFAPIFIVDCHMQLWLAGDLLL